MKVAIGADHRGYEYKEYIKKNIQSSIEWIDVGAYSKERSDYPYFAQLVAGEIVEKRAEGGVLICGTGVGMAIAANRFRGIYAGVAWNEKIAALMREHDNSNIIVLPADFVSLKKIVDIVETWLCAKFKRGRYQERINLIDHID